MYGVRRKVNKQAITFNLFVSLCVQSLSFIWLFVTPWTTHIRFPCPSLSPGVCSNSCPLTLWCHPTVSSFVAHFFCGQEPTIFPSIRVFSSESAPHIRWSKYWSFSFSNSLSNEYSGLISFRTDWFDILAVQVILKIILQHHNSKASVLQFSTSFMVQLSHPCMTFRKTIAFIVWNFVGKLMSLLFNMLSRFVIAFLPRNKCLSISWMQFEPESPAS